MGLKPRNFLNSPGSSYGKAAWNLRLQADSANITRLSTETRIKRLGQAAHEDLAWLY
jgi:hypothetical protein